MIEDSTSDRLPFPDSGSDAKIPANRTLREGLGVGHLVNLIYAAVLLVASPWLVLRTWQRRKPLGGLGMKLSGDLRRQRPSHPCVWFHAVSVGEVLQLRTLLPHFAARFPDHEIVVTTTTVAGREVALRLPHQPTVLYWPFDFTWAVERALRQIQPELVVLVELEVWPNFVRSAAARKIPVVVANGRLSERSARGYRRLRPLLRSTFGRLSAVGAQSEDSATRFQLVGVPAEKVVVTGNLKYDGAQTDRQGASTNRLRNLLGLGHDDAVFIAGSTQAPEEELAIAAYSDVRKLIPNLRLILVPRHPERFDEVARLVEHLGLPLHRRSSDAPCTNSESVRLLDTLGELTACWGLADVAFVGGSLLNSRGGQNMLEPAAFGAAVLFGPNTWNFRAIVADLLERRAAIVVNSGEELTERVRQLLTDPVLRQSLGDSARDLVQRQQGAAIRTMDLLAEHLRGQTFVVRQAA